MTDPEVTRSNVEILRKRPREGESRISDYRRQLIERFVDHMIDERFGDLAYERDCQKHIFEAGGFGAMGYIFEWTNTEVFAYLAAQHLWRNRGIPGVSNENQTDILDYAYRLYYGNEVGRLVARAMDEGSDVNDAMVLEGVYGSQ